MKESGGQKKAGPGTWTLHPQCLGCSHLLLSLFWSHVTFSLLTAPKISSPFLHLLTLTYSSSSSSLISFSRACQSQAVSFSSVHKCACKMSGVSNAYGLDDLCKREEAVFGSSLPALPIASTWINSFCSENHASLSRCQKRDGRAIQHRRVTVSAAS